MDALKKLFGSQEEETYNETGETPPKESTAVEEAAVRSAVGTVKEKVKNAMEETVREG